MKRDLDAAISFLFPSQVDQIREHLAPLPNDRVRWAVLACSGGEMKAFDQHLKYALSDWRDVLQSESMSDTPKGPGLRALPRPEELAFRLHARDLERLAFFDRVVRSGAAAFDASQEAQGLVRALTERAAPHYGSAAFVEAPPERAHFLLLHVMQRSFADAETARASELLAEFESFATIERSFVSCNPDPPPIQPNGRPDRSGGRLNYRVSIVLLGRARVWGLWMVHGNG
jgi:hypothetical protein